jgi:hypothetical protein
MAAIRNANWYELGLVHPKVKANKPPVYADPKWIDLLESVDRDGCLDVPGGPGLGVDVDWAFVNQRKTGQTVYHE